MFLVRSAGWSPGPRVIMRKASAVGPTTAYDREVYVSPLGNDAEDGLTPETAVRTVTEGIARLRDGHNDWLLLMPGLHPEHPLMLQEDS